jgi:hypothetical protein
VVTPDADPVTADTREQPSRITSEHLAEFIASLEDHDAA